jgi:hypothetical protein
VGGPSLAIAVTILLLLCLCSWSIKELRNEVFIMCICFDDGDGVLKYIDDKRFSYKYLYEYTYLKSFIWQEEMGWKEES